MLPPIDPPGHASCSSAPATDPWLLARVLKEVIPAEAHAALDRMAERSARNREVVGVPDPSDSEALATETFPLLDAGPVFRALEATAKAEWADDRAD